MTSDSVKLQILSYIKQNTDNLHLVTYPEICSNLFDTTDSYIAVALRRMVKESLIFHRGSYHSYSYGITVKGLKYLKDFENAQELEKLTFILKQVAGL
jgi:DNA-binding PadR family transcriptional regulator